MARRLHRTGLVWRTVLLACALSLAVWTPARAQRARSTIKTAAPRPQVQRPKIVATLGPKTAGEKTLRGMLRAGMDGARINLSHNGAREVRTVVSALRAAAAKEGRSVPLFFDLPGGKVRLGKMTGSPVTLRSGRAFTISSVPGTLTTASEAGVNYKGLEKHVRPGSRLLLDDGKIELEVTGVRGPKIATRVVRGGPLRSRMGLGVKDVELPFPSMTAQDRRKLKIAVDNGASVIGVSFVQTERNVLAVRRALDRMGAHHVKILAKIESHSGIENLEKIMDHADGIMIARGDLAAAVGPENLPRVQADLAARARGRNVEFMVATGLMSNMITQAKPSAANRADVRRTTEQGPRWLMLNETAIGAYPTETVRALSGELPP